MFVDRAVVSFLVTAWTNSILWSENDEVFKEFSESNLSRVCQNIESAVKNGKMIMLLCLFILTFIFSEMVLLSEYYYFMFL